MSFFWWFFGSMFIFLGVYYAFVGYDKYHTRRKGGAIVRPTTIPEPHLNQPTTVIYTIPTTHQLSQQYPQLVNPYPGQGNNRQSNPPPYIVSDPPPTYDQVVIYPAPETNDNTTTMTVIPAPDNRVRSTVLTQQVMMV